MKQPRKESILGIKVAPALLDAIDREATREGLTRSAIIRRHLLRAYQRRSGERQR